MVARVALAGILILAVMSGHVAARDPIHVREPLANFLEDPNKVASLLRGVAVMKSRDSAPKDSAEYRTSWEYWAAIHGYPGPATGTIEQWQEFLASRSPAIAPLLSGFFAGLENKTPPDALASEVWATCQHNTPHFFTWHRMYLYFFERVLRAASGDPNFALPYWDYTELGTTGDEPWRLPQIFIAPELATPSGPIPNPLFEPRRTAGFGDGLQLDTAATDVDNVLRNEEFESFQGSIDGGVHAYVHCAVGNACLAPRIGIVPFSAADPIFWHHHANVDRMWSCWLNRHGTDHLPPAGSEWMNQTFTFVDETGERQPMQVAELFDPDGRMDYRYDAVDAEGCFRNPMPEVAIAEATSDEPTAAAAPAAAAARASRSEQRVLTRSLALDELTERVPLARADAAAAGAAAAEATDALPSGPAVLRLRGVTADAQPGAAIAVELVAPATGKRARVGTIGFFAIDHVTGAHAHRSSRDYAFDVTAALRELGAASIDELAVELRAESLLPPPGAAAAPASAATAELSASDTATALQNLDAQSTRELLSGLESPLRPAAPVAPSIEATGAVAAAAAELYRSANVEISEIVIEFGD